MRVLRELQALLRLPGFRRLFTVRLVSQTGDGLFQVGLAMLFFFNPEEQSTAAGVAAAFAVMLAPFTVVGPWVGVLLDRWRRRQVLVYGNLLRAALALTIAVLMVTTGVTVVVYALALVTLSVNRFLLAALSAGLPRVVDGPLLLTANSIVPTLGAGAAALGAGTGVVIGILTPSGTVADGAALAVTAAILVVAAALATRLGRDQLGPDRRDDTAVVVGKLRELARGLAEGARYLVARGTPAQGLAVMAYHRFWYGLTFVASILISRNLLNDPADADAGLATFGTVLALSTVGFGLAVVLTPVLSPVVGAHRWIALCLLLAAAAQALLVFTVEFWAVLVAAVGLGLAVQAAKIAVDTIVHRDTHDDYRGRAFSLYDVLYNAAFVGAAALAALVLPDTGYSQPVFAVMAGAYLLGALVYSRLPSAPREVPVTQK